MLVLDFGFGAQPVDRRLTNQEERFEPVGPPTSAFPDRAEVVRRFLLSRRPTPYRNHRDADVA
jgi:hypothetical protein